MRHLNAINKDALQIKKSNKEIVEGFDYKAIKKVSTKLKRKILSILMSNLSIKRKFWKSYGFIVDRAWRQFSLCLHQKHIIDLCIITKQSIKEKSIFPFFFSSKEILRNHREFCL